MKLSKDEDFDSGMSSRIAVLETVPFYTEAMRTEKLIMQIKGDFSHSAHSVTVSPSRFGTRIVRESFGKRQAPFSL